MPKTRREIAREVDEILRSGPSDRTSKTSHHSGRLVDFATLTKTKTQGPAKQGSDGRSRSRMLRGKIPEALPEHPRFRKFGARRFSVADRGDPLSTAAGIVVNRVRSSNAYQRGRQEIVRAAIKAIGPSPSIEHLRALGGLTKIVSDQVDRLSIPGLDENLGSPMFPHTPRSQLHHEIEALRSEVQQTLAKQLRSK